MLGLPKYYLRAESGEPHSILDPGEAEPITHSLGLDRGESDSADFTLRAVGSGQATLKAWVTFEVHLGYPGPAFWSGSSARPLSISVQP